MKWNYGSARCRSRRHSSVVAAEEAEAELKRGSCWADMPIELLREVLMKVEKSEEKWPSRRSVVACAGVCRSWREIMKEVAHTPEASGRITFPIAVKQPGPRDHLMQCFLKRYSSSHTFHLYLNLTQALTDEGKFLLAARKYRRTTCTDYVISLHPSDMSKANGNYIGKVRSNFLGSKFTIYDASPPLTGAKMVKSHHTYPEALKSINSRFALGNYEVAHISYELNGLGNRSKSTSKASESRPGGSLVLKNKAPRWHEQLQCWCLNFHGRVTVASVKNFQLVASPENGVAGPECEKVILQFGKVAKDVFTMDFRYPLSPFLAFAICLSNFDSKLTCD